MSDDSQSTERKKNIWAPWRMPYIESLSEEPDSDSDGCFLCQGRDQVERQRENLVLWRGTHTLTILNRYPYTGGHAMVAPLEHVGEMTDLPNAALLEMMRMVIDLQTALQKAICPQGFNVGINIGRCAGAGLPGHLHMHVVPRWGGDANFMAVVGDVRVVVTSLEDIYTLVTDAAAELNLPRANKVARK